MGWEWEALAEMSWEGDVEEGKGMSFDAGEEVEMVVLGKEMEVEGHWVEEVGVLEEVEEVGVLEEVVEGWVEEVGGLEEVVAGIQAVKERLVLATVATQIPERILMKPLGQI